MEKQFVDLEVLSSVAEKAAAIQESAKTPATTKEKISLKTCSLELPPCKICGGKASGLHYGVNSCEACKGFFRRFLLRKEPYKCSKSGQCSITDSPRGNCSACRMQKCLDFGMSKEAVCQGRYTLTKRTQTINEVKKLQEQSCTDLPPKKKLCVEENFSNNDSENQICGDITAPADQTISSPDSGIDSLLVESPGTPGSIALSTIQSVDSPFSEFLRNGDHEEESEVIQSVSKEDYFIPADDSSWTDKIIPRLVTAMHDLSPVTSKLSDHEINQLLKDGLEKHKLKEEMFGTMEPLSMEEYNKIYEETGLDVDGRQQRMARCFKIFKFIIKYFVKFSRAIPFFQDLPVSDQSSLLKSGRFEFFMILEHRAVDPDLDMLITMNGDVYHLNECCAYVPKIIMRSWFAFAEVIRQLSLSLEERALVMAISLTFSDRAKLEEPEKVDKIQMNMINHLRHILKQRYGKEERQRFTKIMNMFISFRELSEEYKKQYNILLKDKFLPKKFPELLLFLFEDDM